MCFRAGGSWAWPHPGCFSSAESECSHLPDPPGTCLPHPPPLRAESVPSNFGPPCFHHEWQGAGGFWCWRSRLLVRVVTVFPCLSLRQVNVDLVGRLFLSGIKSLTYLFPDSRPRPAPLPWVCAQVSAIHTPWDSCGPGHAGPPLHIWGCTAEPQPSQTPYMAGCLLWIMG